MYGELVPAKREICIQDLLNMTSGIPYPDCWSESQKKMGAFYGEIDRRNATDHPVDTQEFARRVGEEVPLLFQPGEKWSYGASADILGGQCWKRRQTCHWTSCTGSRSSSRWA